MNNNESENAEWKLDSKDKVSHACFLQKHILKILFFFTLQDTFF
jgi:hypothetical protein